MVKVERLIINTVLLAIINWIVVIVIAFCGVEKPIILCIAVGIIDYLYIKRATERKTLQCLMHLLTTFCANIFVGYLVLVLYEKIINDEGLFSIFYLFIYMMGGMGLSLLFVLLGIPINLIKKNL